MNFSLKCRSYNESQRRQTEALKVALTSTYFGLPSTAVLNDLLICWELIPASANMNFSLKRRSYMKASVAKPKR
jgi:hypothetical protein